MIDKTPAKAASKAPAAKPTPAPAAKAKPEAKAAPTQSAPAKAAPQAARGSTAQLQRRSGVAASDPAAASVVTGRQSHTAAKMTGSEQPSVFDRLAKGAKADGGLLSGLKDRATDVQEGVSALAQQQRDAAGVKREAARDQAAPPAPKGFAEGDKIAAPPNLSKEKPVREEKRPNGAVEETFKVDGQTYTRVTRENGTATTSYDVDGVSHRATKYDDGRSAHQIQTGQGDERHTRTVERDRAGHLAKESYSYEGQKGTLSRLTEHNSNGTSKTRTDRSYAVDAPLGDLAEAPAVPEHATDVVSLPQNGRGKTQVRESEVVTTAANGKQKVQGRETSLTQSSTDVSSFEPGAQISHTVTTTQARDKDGKLTKATSGSQTLTVPSDRGGTTRLSDSWNSRGETSQQYSRSKLSSGDLDSLKDDAEDKSKREGDGGPTVTIADRKIRLLPPGGDGGLDRGKAGDWLKDSPNRETVDLDVTMRRNAKGEAIAKTTTFSALDAKGNGRTATRTWAPHSDPKGKDPVEWAYTKLRNNGRDYDRQTGYENSTVSTFERHRELGPGQFKHTSESKDGDNVIARSSADRVELKSLSEVEARVSADQAARLKAVGPPYIVERTSASTELWKDKDGKVIRDEKSDKPLQGESTTQTLTVSNKQGYAVTENSQSFVNEDGSRKRASLSAVSDPSSNRPYRATVEKGTTPAGSCDEVIDERSKITIDRNGQVQIDGKDAARLGNLGGADFNAMLIKDPNAGVDVLAGLTGATGSSGVADNLSRASKEYIDARYNELGFDAPDYKHLAKLNGAAGILSLTNGAADIFKGLNEGGVDGAVKAIGGAGGIAGGLQGTALAASALPGRAGSFGASASGLLGSGTASKFLGRATGLGSVVVGGYDLFTGDSTEKKISGGLTAVSGGLFIGAAASTGTIVGAPAGVVLAGAGVVVGAAGLVVGLLAPDEEESTAPKVDSRLGSG